MQKELKYLGYLLIDNRRGKTTTKESRSDEKNQNAYKLKKIETILRNGQFLQRRVEKLFIHSHTFEQTIIQNRQTELEMGKRATNKKTLTCQRNASKGSVTVLSRL